jgi:hypothetical protein
MRTASELNNDEFIRVYNNPNLSNAQVCEELDTNWGAIVTKKRVNKTVANALTVNREGGVSGTVAQRSVEATPIEATPTMDQPTRTALVIEEVPVANIAVRNSLPPAEENFYFTAIVKNNTTGESIRHEIPGTTMDAAYEQIKEVLMSTTNTLAQNEAGEFVQFKKNVDGTYTTNIRPGSTVMIMDKLSKAAR